MSADGTRLIERMLEEAVSEDDSCEGSIEIAALLREAAAALAAAEQRGVERVRATTARLEQIIELSLRDDTHVCSRIRELAERALSDLSSLAQPSRRLAG
jgi:hypothetical protein